MIIQITQGVLQDFREKIENNEVISLRIERGEDGSYYADYTMFSGNTGLAKMQLRLRAVEILQEFSDVLLVDKVEAFEMYYNYEEDTCVVRNSYMIASSEIDRVAKLDQIKRLLVDALAISEDLNIQDESLPEIVEKQMKPSGNKKAPAPKPVTVGRAIEKLHEVLTR